tara:strand:- start:99 stop:254 length:156 start_codon:yes stop_codon:yes gene_type:complete
MIEKESFAQQQQQQAAQQSRNLSAVSSVPPSLKSRFMLRFGRDSGTSSTQV